MNRALCVSEVLNLVFCLVDTFTLLSAARVCRLWNDQITPMVWEFANAGIFGCLSAIYKDEDLYEVSFIVRMMLCYSATQCLLVGLPGSFLRGQRRDLGSFSEEQRIRSPLHYP